ncbi:hypothetical protein JMUB7518_27410 [Staphylococcus aureus]
MTKKEISFLEQLQNKNEDMQKFEKQMKKEGFKKIKLEDKNSKLKYLATEANDKNAYGYIANNAYKNEKTKEIVVSETIYDNYNKKITKFIAEKRSMTENKEGKILINKNYVEYKAEKVDKNRPVTYAGFKWIFNFLMIRRPPRSTPSNSSAASDVYKRQHMQDSNGTAKHSLVVWLDFMHVLTTVEYGQS